MIVVAKVGTSSITGDTGEIDASAVGKFCAEVVRLRQAGHRVVMVTSGAIAAGLPALGMSAVRPRDAVTLQAASAVGQSRLMRVYDAALAEGGNVTMPLCKTFWSQKFGMLTDRFGVAWMVNVVAEPPK